MYYYMSIGTQVVLKQGISTYIIQLCVQWCVNFFIYMMSMSYKLKLVCGIIIFSVLELVYLFELYAIYYIISNNFDVYCNWKKHFSY